MTDTNHGAASLGRLIKASETPLFRVALTFSSVAAVGIGSLWLHESASLILLGCSTSFLMLLIAFRLDYLHPSVAFMLPWTFILQLSVVPISKFAHPLQTSTILFVLETISIWLAVTCWAEIGAGGTGKPTGGPPADAIERPISRIRSAVTGAFLVLYGLAAVSVVHAGFVPLLSLITTGNSSYMSFGIPSFYGAFLALANALACLALYLYFRSRDRLYLLLFLSVLAIHVLFVTRQNVVTLLVEAFVIRTFTRQRFSRVTIIIAFAIFLTLFSLLGTLRSGNINSIIGVREGYAWVPEAFIWLYAYSYFNVLNLENMITLSGAPYYDGSMWRHLLPSVLRPEYVHLSYLQIAAMNVTSYMYPIYFDVGNVGVKIWTLIWAVITVYWYRRANVHRQFSDIAIYGCLFFCALLSFFVDFWFYLPVIFQVVFFKLFQYLLFRPQRRLSHGPAILSND